MSEETKCPNCGATIGSDEAFCGECGTKINRSNNQEETVIIKQPQKSLAMDFFRGCASLFGLIFYFVASTIVSIGLIAFASTGLESAFRAADRNSETILQQTYQGMQLSNELIITAIAILGGCIITFAVIALCRINSLENKIEDLKWTINSQK